MTAIQSLVTAIILLYFAHRSHYFSLPFKSFKPPKTLSLLISNFILLLIFSILASTILLSVFKSNQMLTIVTPFLLVICLFFYNLIHKELFFSVLKQKEFPNSKSLKHDMFSSLISFGLALFPYLFVNNILYKIVTQYLGPIDQQQLAVEALIDNPLNLITVILLAPMIEEFLFRGLLQNALRQKLNPILSILISSLAFALFHYSKLQGALNLILIPSLFVFALFLGHLYEKTRSLISSIILHSTFNTISAIYILYLNH